MTGIVRVGSIPSSRYGTSAEVPFSCVSASPEHDRFGSGRSGVHFLPRTPTSVLQRQTTAMVTRGRGGGTLRSGDPRSAAYRGFSDVDELATEFDYLIEQSDRKRDHESLQTRSQKGRRTTDRRRPRPPSESSDRCVEDRLHSGAGSPTSSGGMVTRTIQRPELASKT